MWRSRPARASGACASLAAALLVVAAGGAAHADVPLIERDGGSFVLGGYVRTLAGVQTYEHWEGLDALVPDSVFGQGAGVARLEWTGTVGDRLTLDLHQRLLFRAESRSLAGFDSGLGVGVSEPPEANLDLRTVLLEAGGDGGGRTYAEHDIDRLSVRVYLDRADLTVGRQAVAWGNSLLFPVADVWTRFSPFELDTMERRGVDGFRVLASPGSRWELDGVAVDRGAFEDLGVGVRGTRYGARSDVWLGAAKTWEEVFAAGGWARDLGKATVRGEAMVPLGYGAESGDSGAEPGLPRATVGVDHYRSRLALSGELHFSGAGAAPDGDYAAHVAGSAPHARREVYLLGRYYAGASASWEATPVVRLSLASLVNLGDPSAILTPSLSWQAADDVELGLGGFVPIGANPVVDLANPRLRSEFGSAPYFVYGQLVAMF